MKLNVPIRYSRDWWLVIGATTLVVGVVAFIFLRFRTDFEIKQLIVFWFVATVVGDLITAMSMEAVAPTRLMIGPGDRRLDADQPTEFAVVVSEFDDSGFGRVQVRGETWRARQAAPEEAILEAGTQVRVVDREGLTLVVSAGAS